MRALIKGFIILIIVGFFARTFAQLPPEIQVDKHLIHAEQLHTAKDYAAAFEVMQKIIALQKEHSLAVPDDFHFKYAQVALSADSMRIALESVTRYLAATGKEGQHYQEALKVMLKAEGNEVMSPEDFYNDVIKAQGTCDGLPEGSKCWMALTNHPDCYVWNDDLSPGESVIWNGRCAGHAAEGEGTLTWYSIRDVNGRQTKRKVHESKGRLKNGKKEGKWVKPYTINMSDGSIYQSGVVKTHYANGMPHGPVIDFYKESDETNVFYLFFYLRGKKIHDWFIFTKMNISLEEDVDQNGNGRLVFRSTDGSTWGGPLVNGKRHGQWEEFPYNGKVRKGVYVNGKRHGHWVERRENGTVEEGTYDNGEREGQWIGRNADGEVVLSGAYVDGQKHGKWTDWIRSHWVTWTGNKTKIDGILVGKGIYVKGDKHGTWVYSHPIGDILKIEYKDGDSQVPNFWYDYDEGKCWRMTEEKRKKVNKNNCLE